MFKSKGAASTKSPTTKKPTEYVTPKGGTKATKSTKKKGY